MYWRPADVDEGAGAAAVEHHLALDGLEHVPPVLAAEYRHRLGEPLGEHDQVQVQRSSARRASVRITSGSGTQVVTGRACSR